MADPPTQHASPFFVEAAGDELDGALYEVTADGLLVGRSPICDVQIEDREVSRRHAYFYPDGATCCVKDMGARNGILVNGGQVKECRLEAGDVVDVGPIRFTLLVEGRPAAVVAPEAAAPPPAQSVFGSVTRHPLLVVAPVFGAMACTHWAFGLGAIVLAIVGLWELEGTRAVVGRPLIVAGLLMGLAGTGMHAWFGEFAPRIREGQWRTARDECCGNLTRVAAALKAYALEYGPDMPARLDVLADAELMAPEALNCPGWSVAETRARPYLFPGAGLSSVADADVIACDADPGFHQDRGGWVLTGAGDVEWFRNGRFAQLLHRLAGTGRQDAPADTLARGGR